MNEDLPDLVPTQSFHVPEGTNPCTTAVVTKTNAEMMALPVQIMTVAYVVVVAVAVVYRAVDWTPHFFHVNP